ncbi:MAG: hypothetical protein OEZ06_29525 [Myxococcales bacterium]|nr:hypothetical protein [Myxococcales bacterium]
MRQDAIKRVKAFVDTQAPRYRPLLEHRAVEIERISATMSETALDLELHRLLSSWRHEVRRDAQERLRQVEAEPSSFAQHREAYVKVLGELQEVQKSDLAEYVVHRATVLTFFEKLLGKQDDGRFSREDALHELVFPLRTTSNDIDYDEHNLWVLDERLAYHRFLASDMPFSQQAGPVDVESEDRPDLLIYNNPFALAPGSEFGSVVVVEFKRPERRDVGDEKSPIRQTLRYVKQIREGKASRVDGSTINVPETTPFFCYVVATLTQALHEDAREHGFTQAPDGHGYFHFNQNYKAYIEVSDYRKVLDDAKKRNRAFFDRLEIDVR